MTLNQQRHLDRRQWWMGKPWRPAGFGYGFIVCKAWICNIDERWYVLQGGLYRSDMEFMRERVRGPFSTEDEALAVAWRWAGVTPERQDDPPLWAAHALDFYVRGWDTVDELTDR